VAEGDREGDIMGKKVPGCELYVTTVYKIYIPIYNWLVVSTPLKNMSPSVGMMTFPIYGK
jgi:hypothetical protein